jgi:hypothetical protein
MSDATLLRGGAALSPFRQQRVLAQLRAVNPAVRDVQAQFLHFVLTSRPLSTAEHERLVALLDDGLPFVNLASASASASRRVNIGLCRVWGRLVPGPAKRRILHKDAVFQP